MLNDYSHYYPITVPLLWHCLKQYRQTTSACYFADQKKGVFPSEGGFFVVIQMFTGGYMYQIHSNPPDVRSAKPSPMSPVQCLTVPLRMGVSSVQECARQVPSSGYLIGKSEKKTKPPTSKAVKSNRRYIEAIMMVCDFVMQKKYICENLCFFPDFMNLQEYIEICQAYLSYDLFEMYWNVSFPKLVLFSQKLYRFPTR